MICGTPIVLVWHEGVRQVVELLFLNIKHCGINIYLTGFACNIVVPLFGEIFQTYFIQLPETINQTGPPHFVSTIDNQLNLLTVAIYYKQYCIQNLKLIGQTVPQF